MYNHATIVPRIYFIPKYQILFIYLNVSESKINKYYTTFHHF